MASVIIDPLTGAMASKKGTTGIKVSANLHAAKKIKRARLTTGRSLRPGRLPVPLLIDGRLLVLNKADG